MSAVSTVKTVQRLPHRAAAAVRQATLPELFVYAMIFVSPLIAYRIDLFGLNLSLQRLLILFALGSWVLYRLFGYRFTPSNLRSVFAPLGAFVVLIAHETLQLPFTQQPAYAYRFVAILVVGFVIVTTMILVLDNPRKLRLAILTFVASALVPAGMGIYQSLGRVLGYTPVLPFWNSLSLDRLFLGNFQTRLEGELVARIPSTLTSPAFYGEFLVFVILFLLAFLICKRLGIVYALVVTVMLSLLGFNLLATIARSAWLLMVLGLVMVLLNTRREIVALFRNRVSHWILPGTVAGVLILVSVTNFPLGATFTSSLNSLTGSTSQTAPELAPVGKSSSDQEVKETVPSYEDREVKSTTAHLRLRGEAVDVFLQNPIFGVGLGNFGPKIDQEEGVSSAQTYGFTVLAEGGLVGISILLLFMGSILLPVRRVFVRKSNDRSWRPYLLALYISLALLMFNNLLIYDTLFRDTSWVLIGLGLVAVRNFSSGGEAGSPH